MRCPVCRRRTHAQARDPGQRPTIDHIIPKAWGGRDLVGNRRMLCHRCNELRGTTMHCVAALACAFAIERDFLIPVNTVIRSWRLTGPDRVWTYLHNARVRLTQYRNPLKKDSSNERTSSGRVLRHAEQVRLGQDRDDERAQQ